jgi:antitoxin component of RelBE/YafQ-DinJ toxin-antitoxin module
MSEAPLPNNEAARSPTGEITDVRDLAPSTTTQTSSEQTKPEGSTTSEISQTKPPTDAEGGSKQPDPKAPDAPKAPDTYAAFTAPENYTIDAKLLEQATPLFKELGLTQDQAQKLVDIQVARELALAKAPQDAYAATRADWQAKVKADAEISAYSKDGKTGTDAVKIDIGKAINTLPADLQASFREAMDITGAGDHPAFVKAMWKFAQAIGEGKPVSGAGPSPAGQTAPGAKPPSAAQAMYPNLK